MSKEANAGTGVNLSSKFYIRNFYSTNQDASSDKTRSKFSNSRLSFEDATALRRAVKKLGNFSYDDDSSTNIRSSAKAFISTYNNLISSASEASDDTISRNVSKLKSLTKEYADELDKIGITVNNDGTLTNRDTLLGSADISKFENLFGKDSDFMQKAGAYAKHIQNRSEALYNAEKNKSSHSASADRAQDVKESDGPTEAAQIAAQSGSLENLLNLGIGKNVDLIL